MQDPDLVQDIWAREQIAPWLHGAVSIIEHENICYILNNSEENVFIIEFRENGVFLKEKPIHARHQYYEYSLKRAVLYERFFRACLERHPVPYVMTVPIYVGDGALDGSNIPVFSFQKPKGNKSPLLPDVDLAESIDSINDIPFYQKIDKAIFAGSTSGGLNTMEIFQGGGGSPRVQAGLFFRDHPDVDFLLPVLVQCAQDGVADELRGLGFGDGHTISWHEQFLRKFIISMDGNGATCLRVYFALLSNSALLKYNSNSLLYYFSGLIPWRHFVPIADHGEIPAIIDIERRHPDFFSVIASEGRAFAERYLNKGSRLLYTASLLNYYALAIGAAKRRGEAPHRSSGDGAAATQSAGDAETLDHGEATGLAIIVHVQNTGNIRGIGDAWVGSVGSRLWIEGVAILTSEVLEDRRLLYRVFDANGAGTAFVKLGEYAGTKGLSQPITGFEIKFEDGTAADLALVCWAAFTDGSIMGPVFDGVVRSSDKGAYLEAIRVLAVKNSAAR